jgi:hypothetical protein
MNNNIFYNAYKYYINLKNDNLEISSNNRQVIGFFDNKFKIWYNAWSMTTVPEYIIEFLKKKNVELDKDLYRVSNELLKYGLNIHKDLQSVEPDRRYLIKTILINSKFYINEKKTQLDIILAIIAYLIKAKKVYYINDSNVFIYIVEI